MTSYLSIQNLTKFYSLNLLFKGISFTVYQGDRIGLLGPNGAGKSTLLKLIMGFDEPNEGTISKKKGLRIGYAAQSPIFEAIPVEQVLMSCSTAPTEIEKQTEARVLLSKAAFLDYNQSASALSGGWKKRLDILCAMIQKPDLLLLDEPTNHMDLEGILWLEKFLEREKISFLVVSHDRYFLDRVCNKMIELNPGFASGLLICNGSLSDYLEQKEAYFEAQLQEERGIASVVREEIEWLRKSPKARTTKSQSRIQNAYEMMESLEKIKQRNQTKKVTLEFTSSERETRKLLVAKNIGKSLGGRQLFKGLDILLAPGTRIGLVGKNGTGKTTLMKILSGKIAPDIGTLKYADDLKIVYFDQHREKIPPETRLRDALSPHSDYVNYLGQQIHVHGWAKKFLFQEERMNLPVSCLSGGEQARILIARLMLEPADLLFLDEPTNDLDIPTLEVMEESLKEFKGAVVLISHDRCLMDRVCNQIIGLGEDLPTPYYADYTQWEKAIQSIPEKRVVSSKVEKTAVAKKNSSTKLTYNEKRDLESMETKILETEQQIEVIQSKLSSLTLQTDQASLLYQQLADTQKQLEFLFERWDYLSKKESGSL